MPRNVKFTTIPLTPPVRLKLMTFWGNYGAEHETWSSLLEEMVDYITKKLEEEEEDE